MLHRSIVAVSLLTVLASACAAFETADVAPKPDGLPRGSEADAGQDAAPEASSPPPPGCDTSKAPSENLCVLSDAIGIFVSASRGADDGLGTHDKPVKGLSLAIELAKKNGKSRIYVCAESYAESLVMADGVSMYGGLSCDGSWGVGKTPTKIASPTLPAMTASNVTKPTVLSGFDITAPDASVAGGHSIGVVAVDSAGLTMVEVKVTAGAGAKGANGADAETVVMGDQVSNGDTLEACSDRRVANCSNNHRQARSGNFGPAACRTKSGNVVPALTQGGPGGRPGHGGTYQCYSYDGGDRESVSTLEQPSMDAAGESVGSARGVQANVGPAVAGKPGRDGAVGGNATLAVRIEGVGLLSSNGQSGGDGAGGQGGGGGPGRAITEEGVKLTGCWSDTINDVFAGTGATGGPGGCGGLGGSPGGGGGSSVAILLIRSPVVLERVTLETSAAGAAGASGFGSDGTGGFGRYIWTTPSSGSYVSGGKGGNGGDGGNGVGGSVIGILHHDGAPKSSGSKFKLGAAGAGVAARTRGARTIAASASGLSEEQHAF